MTIAEKNVLDIIADGQSKEYKSFIRAFTGRVTQVVELKNPLPGSMLVDDIERILEIINPDLQREITWLKELKKSLEAWCNEKIIANRILGLTNDNEYDVTVFEKVVMDRFNMTKKSDMRFEVEFKTLVALVEAGVRSFNK